MAGQQQHDPRAPRIASAFTVRTGLAVAVGCFAATFMLAAPRAAAQGPTVSFPAVTGTMYNGNNTRAPDLGLHQRPAAVVSPTGTDASPTTDNKGGESGTSRTGGGN